jgi:hypothetical protein
MKLMNHLLVWVSVCLYITLIPESWKLSCLYTFGMDRKENAASNSSLIVSNGSRRLVLSVLLFNKLRSKKLIVAAVLNLTFCPRGLKALSPEAKRAEG